jgi:superfamily II RNA helicase
MKITIEQYEHTVTHEVPFNDVDLDEAVRMVEGLLRAIGYHFSGTLEIVSEWSDNDEWEEQNNKG